MDGRSRPERGAYGNTRHHPHFALQPVADDELRQSSGGLRHFFVAKNLRGRQTSFLYNVRNISPSRSLLPVFPAPDRHRRHAKLFAESLLRDAPAYAVLS